MKQKLFIYTTSKQSAEKLIQMGFVLVRHVENEWTFINDKRKTFDQLDKTVYTNKIDFD